MVVVPAQALRRPVTDKQHTRQCESSGAARDRANQAANTQHDDLKLAGQQDSVYEHMPLKAVM
jgi:hypothetical protein